MVTVFTRPLTPAILHRLAQTFHEAYDGLQTLCSRSAERTGVDGTTGRVEGTTGDVKRRKPRLGCFGHAAMTRSIDVRQHFLQLKFRKLTFAICITQEHVAYSLNSLLNL